MPGNGKKAEEWSSKDKFRVVLETAGLNEAELADCLPGYERHPAKRTRDQREQSKTDRKRIKQLEKELLRKEKALAEAAALIAVDSPMAPTPK